MNELPIQSPQLSFMVYFIFVFCQEGVGSDWSAHPFPLLGNFSAPNHFAFAGMTSGCEIVLHAKLKTICQYYIQLFYLFFANIWQGRSLPYIVQQVNVLWPVQQTWGWYHVPRNVDISFKVLVSMIYAEFSLSGAERSRY